MTSKIICGVPVRLDLLRLSDAFGVPETGAAISHKDISAVLGCDSNSNRYATIVCAWRRKLERENNLLLVSDRGIGYIAADPKARVGAVTSKYKSGIRAVRIAGNRAMLTDRETLSDAEKKTLDFVSGAAAKIRLVDKTEPKRIAFVE